MLRAVLKRNINLNEGEFMEGLIRSSLWAYFWPLALSVFSIILPFFLMYYLLQKGPWGIAVFAALLIFGLGLGGRACVRYRLTALVMTNFRIIDMNRRGFFNQEITVVSYNKMRDVYCQTRGIVKTLFNIGDLEIDLSDKKTVKIKLTCVRNPQKAASDLLWRQKNHIKNSYNAEQLLIRIKEKLGPEAYNKLIGG